MKFEHAEQSLKDCFFKTARPISFNDPFECRGRFVNFDEMLRKYIHDNYEQLRFEAILNGAVQNAVTEEFLYGLFSKALGKSDRSWLSTVDQIVLVMCFVKERKLRQSSDVLFWSHYADSGCGVRITFDLLKQPRGGLYYMKDVKYENEVPVFDCSQMKEWLCGSEYYSYIESVAYTKGKAWEYENEIRMIIPRNLRDLQLSLKSESMNYLLERNIGEHKEYFVKISYDAIRRVDFGLRVDADRKDSLIRFLRQNPESSHISFYETEFDPVKYAYQYHKVA